MPLLKEEFVQKVLALSEGGEELLHIVESFRGEGKKEGASRKFSCPLCGSEHTLVVTPGRKIAKCFGCDTGGAVHNAVGYLMKYEKMDFMRAIEYIASDKNLLPEYQEPEKKTKGKKAKASSSEEKFCDRMLRDSGLTSKDVIATTVKETDGESTVTEKRRTFISGTLTSRGEIDKKGDDAVILYFDLDGRPIQFTNEKDKTQAVHTYVRVRYQFPEEHCDKSGKPMKYRSPAGSPTFIYFPETIRAAYKARETIETLFIQEGEKKAEKACKHGIPSVAVSGIQNLGYKGTLPEEIIKLVEACSVKNVCFLLDSDCFDLTTQIKIDEDVARRPKGFFYAVKNYKEYFNRLKNRNLYCEIYFGYVKKNDAGDKGIDDLLTNTLKGKEDKLRADIDAAMNEKDMAGEYVQLHKITTATDAKILEIWSLQSSQEFCNKYREQLQILPEFTFGNRHLRYNAEGELESAQPLQPDEIFWSEHINGRTQEKEYSFLYVGAINFLENRGFWRYEKPSGDYDFIHVENGIAQVVQPYKVGDFVKNFTKDCLSKNILEMLYRGGVQYLGPEKLGNLRFYQGQFDQPVRGIQNLFFANAIWQVTADSIKTEPYTQMHYNIWSDMRKDFDARTVGPLIKVHYQDGVYSYEVTDAGKKCDFLQFLINASNFTWRKTEVTASDVQENAQHLVAKLAAFGYLCSSAKDRSVAKAVIGMDGKQSEFGESNGRSGKSLMGEAIRYVTSSKAYNGKEFSGQAAKNQFIWDGITEKTNLVFIDDAQRTLDFEILFSLITGDWPVNPKGASPFVLPFAKSPKILVTTNFAISGEGSSFADRQWQLAFSDYYNDEHKPIDDFKVLFFDEWDPEQWNLFWNLVAQCLQIYFKFGYVPSPGDRLEVRKLMQEIGNEFDIWACGYYAETPDGHLNQRLSRQELYNTFLGTITSDRKTFYSPYKFKQKLGQWCKLKGYILNPGMFDPISGKYTKYDKDGRPVLDDKSNGVEYLTVGSGEGNPTGMPSIFTHGEQALDLDDLSDLPSYDAF